MVFRATNLHGSTSVPAFQRVFEAQAQAQQAQQAYNPFAQAEARAGGAPQECWFAYPHDL